ncbi:acetyl-CoA carboxylase biotin carboxyl carrier protein subunit [Bordetella sp. 02P26C-1]|uniref:acetyl-CoA carboxylase biotin carboxyl carrier protein subunit n=1 Tax=Bordetella sp. 02P26C-1 TaxID=2683195 RepID=UPI0013549FDC|nr:acetyl-CoA carboxylase biotin carboxyl carrier protein subunit [Bordetella sp. 02P26C-1]MVW80762.1 biotin/lipoyl-binding protein [Bordetella sp. 02P26C-1]
MQAIESTVAGRIISVLVKPGQVINEGDEVVKIESMKMELPVDAERGGKVVEILVADGDEVEEGQALVRIEG